MIDKPTLYRRLAYAGYFVIAFLLFLFFLFPFDRIKSKLESEVRLRTPFELSVAHISPRFLNSFVLDNVVLMDKQGKVLFESPSVNTTLSLFSLLRGAMSVNVKAAAYGGQLIAKIQQSSGQQYWMFDADNLDMGSYSLFKNLGVKVTGKIGGNFEMNGGTGKGRFWLKNATSRELKVQGFSVPDLDFEKGWLETDVKGDRMQVKKFELDGKDLKVQATGDLVLSANGTLNLTIKIKPSERLMHEQSVLFSLLKNRDPEGYYQLTLGGTLSAPMPRF